MMSEATSKKHYNVVARVVQDFKNGGKVLPEELATLLETYYAQHPLHFSHRSMKAARQGRMLYQLCDCGGFRPATEATSADCSTSRGALPTS